MDSCNLFAGCTIAGCTIQPNVLSRASYSLCPLGEDLQQSATMAQLYSSAQFQILLLTQLLIEFSSKGRKEKNNWE
jgi:hypothetical protein